MLKITSPSNLSSFDRPALFRISGTEPSADAHTAVDAILEDADTGAVLATRRLHLDADASAIFDVAPILQRAMTIRLTGGPTGLAAADDSTFRVRMRVGAAVSDTIALLCTLPARNALSCITSMPQQRTIRYGESDRLLFYCLSDFTVTITAVSDDGQTDVREYMWTGDGGLVTLRLRTSDFASTTSRITISANRMTVAEYDVESSDSDALRLAWRTRSGSVEHYTFPVVARRTAVSGNRTVRLADGTCTVTGECHTQIVARSQYEAEETVAALAGIVTSPQVWAEDEAAGGYVSVVVETQQVTTRSFGEPSNVELTVRPSQNGVML